MTFISKDLNLPLFLASRNRFKFHNPGFMPKYITKYHNSLKCGCHEENETDTATKSYLRHLIGLYPPSDDLSQCKGTSGSKDERSLIDSKAWQLPPNVYNVPAELLKGLKGSGGAHWAKLPKPKPVKHLHLQKNIIQPQFKFYDVPREMERFTRPCNKYKGIFLSNARSRRPSTRFMVFNPRTCYRSPNDPGPTHYIPMNHELKHNLRMPHIKETAPKPTIFLRHSCVPVRENSIHPKNSSFQPGPGRYENRFKPICPCTGKRVYYPLLYIAIQDEKRRKFRRQPFKKIKLHHFCAPNWRHVAGRGHTYLFKEPKDKNVKVKAFKEAKKLEKTLQLYPDARYISMITNPTTYEPFSIRSDWKPYKMLKPTAVKFNCMSRRIMRRQLRNNKKIAFNSGQKRFKDDVRPVQMSMKQLQDIKETLPFERQLLNHPVTRMRTSQIKSQLTATPKHMLPPSTELRLRKPSFKFLPLPPPKILVTVKDTQPPQQRASIPYKPEPHLGKLINPADYLKPGTTLFSIEPRKSIPE